MTAANVLLEPEDHVRYLQALGIEGVGFSGGEPLLVLDRLVAHVEAIRRELGDSVYVWVYSNGDPADPARSPRASCSWSWRASGPISRRPMGPICQRRRSWPTWPATRSWSNRCTR